MKVMEDGSFLDPDRTRRAQDGILTGAPSGTDLDQADTAWVVVARSTEPVEEFFLDGPFGRGESRRGDDPVAWICRGVGRDGTLVIGAVNFERDRFASDARDAVSYEEGVRPSRECGRDVPVSGKNPSEDRPDRRGKPRR